MNNRKLIPRGFLKSFVLLILKEKASHGYEIMEKINEKTGFWRPSPGTVYPLLRSLEREGLIEEIKPSVKRRTYKLTPKGETIAAKIEQTEKKIKEDIISLLAQILNIEKEEIEEIVKKIEENKKLKSKKLAILFSPLHDLNRLSMKFSNQGEQKILKASEVLCEASEKLREILRGRGDVKT
jgi:DNA-binding PadR family transcriptional regulator